MGCHKNLTLFISISHGKIGFVIPHCQELTGLNGDLLCMIVLENVAQSCQFPAPELDTYLLTVNSQQLPALAHLQILHK